MNKTIFATLLECDLETSIVHTGSGEEGLRDCQAYAQRLTEDNQGIASVGIFTPLTKQEQREIVKNNGSKVTVRASRAKSICTVVLCSIPEV